MITLYISILIFIIYFFMNFILLVFTTDLIPIGDEQRCIFGSCDVQS